MNRKSIAIDMDEVLADTFKKVIQTVNELFDLSLTEASVKGRKLWDLLNEEQRIELKEAIHAPGFFRDLEVIDSAVPVVKELSERYDIYIATAAMEVPHSFRDKFEWLEEHFPFLDHHFFIFCGNKKVVKADYLIDDTIRQLDNFTGKGILFKSAHNEHMETEHMRVENWHEVLELFNSIDLSVR